MADAFIFDHVRTPRGRGKPDGSLHEVSTLGLAATVFAALNPATNSIPSLWTMWFWAASTLSAKPAAT